MTIKKIFKPRNLVLLHGWAKMGNIPMFIWRQGDGWFMRLYGITLGAKNTPEKLQISAEPVYVPFFVIERHLGQIIIDIHAWTSSCVTINLQKRRPWIWFAHTSKFFYTEADE